MSRPRRPTERAAERLWTVPVAIKDVPEAGLHVDLAANDTIRAAIAKSLGLRDLPRFEAAFDVTLRGRNGLRVSGRVSATVGQDCVVTLDPLESQIEEPVDLAFSPHAAPSVAADEEVGGSIPIPAVDAPESLIDGTVDLGAIAIEFLTLGIDPYPRKPGVVFEAPAAGDAAGHPFAALAALKSRKSQ